MERIELKFFGTSFEREKRIESSKRRSEMLLLVSGRDNSAIFSGEPLVRRSKESLAKIRTITLVRCKEELNGNARTIPISNGTF